MENNIYYGACVYPELWSDDIMIEDYDHMKELGMNLARMGEFAWSTFEPTPGNYDFSVLERSLELTRERGIKVVVCTPTPTPPIWLTHNHPERLNVNSNGQRMHHGSRQHICTNNKYFRERANLLVDKMMQVVKKYNHVVAIQLDNEFKAHTGHCLDFDCKKLWSEWLENKYLTVENLNNRWGTKIWSQEYFDFNQVVQPLPTPFIHNSSLLLNYKRFLHEKLAEFVREQVKIIKNHSDIPVTHNTGMFFDVDNELIGNEIDFMSFDTYTPVEHYENFVLNHERWRYIRNDTRYTMLLETSTSHNGHLENYGSMHDYGYVEAESFVTYASGTSAFTYWPFRGQRSGCEQPHGSVVSSWGDKTIGYDSVLKVSQLFKCIKPLISETVLIEPKVSITYSDRARTFIDNEHGGVYNYKELMNSFHKHFLDLNIHRKIIPEGHELNGTEVLFSPFMHNISEDYFNRAVEFMKKGGIWFVGPMSGDRTEEHHWHTDNGLGRLGELLNLKSSIQFFSKNKQVTGKAMGIFSELNGLNTLIEIDEKFSKGKVTSHTAQGQSFLVEKKIGKGLLVYLGAHVSEELMKELIQHYASEFRINEIIETSEEVIVFNRVDINNNDFQYWMVNLSREEKEIQLNKSFKNLIDNEIFEKGIHTLAPYKYLVLTLE
ncbi:beta-galactosidase YesZ [Alkalibacterium iburiense]|uniref:Beta-galactosidase n=1 Tax=Alkalibacterium iburiense TaxID=290589 RepID=A0ABP3HFA8_9LACT